MFDNLPVLVEPENVDPGVILITGPLLKTVQHNVVSLGDHPFEVNAFAGVLGSHSLEVGNEGFLAIAPMRIVLDIPIAHVLLDGFPRLALVKHQGIEALGIFLVFFQAIVHCSKAT